MESNHAEESGIAGRRWGRVALVSAVGGMLAIGGVYLYKLDLRSKLHDEAVDERSLITSSIPLPTGGGSGAAVPKGNAIDEDELTRRRQSLSEDAVSTIADFFAASSIVEKAGSVVDRERVLPLMEAYYATHPQEEFEEADFMPIRTFPRFVEAGMSVFALIPRRETDRPTGDPYEDAEALLYIVVGADGRPLLDWETYIQTKDKSVFDYTERPREGTGTFRLSLSEITAVALESDAMILDAADPAVRSRPFEVVVPDGAVADAIRAGLAGLERDRFATVALRWAESESGAGRVEVSELITWGFEGTGWEDPATTPAGSETFVGR